MNRTIGRLLLSRLVISLLTLTANEVWDAHRDDQRTHAGFAVANYTRPLWVRERRSL